jgi:uncharacterized protein (TIGR00369 family)
MDQPAHTFERSGILPWSRSCFVCGEGNPHGLRLKSRLENGAVVLDYTTREADLGWRSLVHGGISMTLLDEVMTWAAIIAARRACVAAELTVRLKAPVRVGQRLRVEGESSGGASRIVKTSARMTDEEGRELATATGKYVPMRSAEASLCADDFVTGQGALELADLLRDG